MFFSLRNKVVVVSGGAGLLGSEFTKMIAREGGIPVIVDQNENKGDGLAGKLRRINKRCEFIKCDITDRDAVSFMIKKISGKFKNIAALINCAYPKNKNYGKPLERVSYEDFCENVNLHLGGYFLASQQFAQFFKKQGFGNIINISSVYGVILPRFEVYEGTAMVNPVEYGVIKSGIIHLTKYMAKYYKGCNIKINCISPGGILDRQPPKFTRRYKTFCLSKGMLNKNDLNGTLIYLLSDLSKFVNGQNIVVDDGFTL